MQVTETLNEGLKRAYQITVPASELDAKVNEKLEESRGEVQMKGFRKGKVPLALLKKQFGPKLLGEAMQETVDGAMSKHFEDSGDRPAMQPKVEMTNANWKEGDDIQVDMSYEALPEIPDFDASGLKLEKMVVTPDDAAVDEALGQLAESRKSYEARGPKGKAKNDDQVVIDFVGSIDGEKFEGGAAEDYPLVLGSNSFIPGFEEQLVGVKTADEIEVKVNFPDDYQAENLAGKEASFAVTVKEVKKPAETVIDDELAKGFGAESLDALKEQIRERLTAEYSGAARAVMKRALLDSLDEQVSFDLPPSLVEAEANQIAHQLWHEDNPEVQGHDHPEVTPTDEHNKLAERRVRLGLLLAELGRKNEISVSDAELTQAVLTQARQYPGQERQFFEFVQNNPQMRQQLQAPIFEDKVVDYVFELATVTEKSVTKDELQAAVAALEDEEAEAVNVTDATDA
ncbi:trigger factor [Oceaniovalibus sp. ACAM 378]|uniref:trigger factor n=1 Tax=Oceaniovalibus sp. ACAM 378 TaxID=2599923 RepID=UPI0011D67324|nr:trigger factor [Oceaniovalibus sp. ACAM 378]TYB89810.1 trigger factor [Oceaniovalibus sp. ACAM 378]